MSKDLTIILTEEQAAFAKAKVARGHAQSTEAVVDEALTMLRERDTAIERWLREDVLPVAIEMRDHPERSVPIDEAFERIEANIRDCAEKRRR